MQFLEQLFVADQSAMAMIGFRPFSKILLFIMNFFLNQVLLLLRLHRFETTLHLSFAQIKTYCQVTSMYKEMKIEFCKANQILSSDSEISTIEMDLDTKSLKNATNKPGEVKEKTKEHCELPPAFNNLNPDDFEQFRTKGHDKYPGFLLLHYTRH